MKLTRSQWLILLGALLTIAIQVVTNIATDQMPDWIQPYLWLAWPLLGLLIVLFLIVSLRQAGAEPRPPDPLQIELYLQAVATCPIESLDREEAYVLLDVREQERPLFPRWVAAFRAPEPEPEAEEAPGEPVEEVLRQEDRLILLGDPGAGKTTTLQHLAQEAAERAPAEGDPIPGLCAAEALPGPG